MRNQEEKRYELAKEILLTQMRKENYMPLNIAERSVNIADAMLNYIKRTEIPITRSGLPAWSVEEEDERPNT